MQSVQRSGSRYEVETTAAYRDGCLTVAGVGRHAARVFSEKTALRAADRSLTHRELDAAADRVAAALVADGVDRGDVVSAYLPNCIDYVIVVLAVARAGAVFSPINPKYKKREVRDLLARSRPRVAFTIRDKAQVILDAAEEARVEAPRLVLCELDGADPGAHRDIDTLAAPEGTALPHVGSEDNFSLMFTSGTTGTPKGALATHKARMVWVLNAAILYGLSSEDVYLGVMPQVHSAGLTFTLMHLYVGGTVEILRDFDAAEYLRTVEERRVTSSLAVPTIIATVLEEIASGGRDYDLASLRRLLSCGAPLGPAQKQAAIEKITPYLYDYYGSTESNSMTVLLPGEQLTKGASVGRPFWNCGIRVTDEDGRTLPADEVGEIWCRNPSIMTEYLNDSMATAAVFRDGWYRTGDLGCLDEDGYLYLVGREKDVIISGGVNIYPREIEQVLEEHPDVFEAAVTGVADPRWGEAVAAYVVMRGDRHLTLGEVQEHVKAHLADYKKPRHMMILPALPKNAGGKTVVSELPPIDTAKTRLESKK